MSCPQDCNECDFHVPYSFTSEDSFENSHVFDYCHIDRGVFMILYFQQEVYDDGYSFIVIT